jgi:PAS domain S-box-containing protein
MNFYTDARDPGTWRESWVYKLPGGELVAIYDDVTQRKRDQDAILQSKVLLQNVIDSTPDWMYVKDREHRFLLVNRSFAEAQHLEPQDVVGRPDSDFFSEELCLGNPEKGITGFHQDDLAAFSGKLVHNPRNVISWVDGTRHTYDTYKIPLTDQAGKIYGALVYSRDITAQARLEDERESTLRTLEKSLANTIDTVAMVVEMRDPYTAGHQRRVARLCGAIAESMGWDDRRIENLLMAAKIHDIGKMYVPADILSKPGKLSETEFSLIKTHARGGYEILRKIEFQGPVALMALQHHERMDGSGYPDGIIGEEILFESRILAVADVVEAMSSHRPYRPARGMDAALEEMSKNRGRLYDAEVVDACLGLFRQGKFKFDE